MDRPGQKGRHRLHPLHRLGAKLWTLPAARGSVSRRAGGHQGRGRENPRGRAEGGYAHAQRLHLTARSVGSPRARQAPGKRPLLYPHRGAGPEGRPRAARSTATRARYPLGLLRPRKRRTDRRRAGDVIRSYARAALRADRLPAGGVRHQAGPARERRRRRAPVCPLRLLPARSKLDAGRRTRRSGRASPFR